MNRKIEFSFDDKIRFVNRIVVRLKSRLSWFGLNFDVIVKDSGLRVIIRQSSAIGFSGPVLQTVVEIVGWKNLTFVDESSIQIDFNCF